MVGRHGMANTWKSRFKSILGVQGAETHTVHPEGEGELSGKCVTIGRYELRTSSQCVFTGMNAVAISQHSNCCDFELLTTSRRTGL